MDSARAGCVSRRLNATVPNHAKTAPEYDGRAGIFQQRFQIGDQVRARSFNPPILITNQAVARPTPFSSNDQGFLQSYDSHLLEQPI